ncbi:MAG: hypothetical protein NT034_04615 [Candidatus Magasanikbacteria bacterium]|nr:hypothetical protein [Candidatus Magasanikbacteria bacterium]
MFKLTLKDSDLNHVLPANSSLWRDGEAADMDRFYTDLQKKNGDPTENLRRGHHELQNFLEKAVRTANQEHLALDQVVVQAPPIMSARGWAQYMSSSAQNEYSGAMLEIWFAQLCQRSHAYEILNAVYRKDRVWIEGGTEIAFHVCGQNSNHRARICCSIGTPWEYRMVK